MTANMKVADFVDVEEISLVVEGARTSETSVNPTRKHGVII